MRSGSFDELKFFNLQTHRPYLSLAPTTVTLINPIVDPKKSHIF